MMVRPSSARKYLLYGLGHQDISASIPPTDVKLTPKWLFSQVLQYDIEFSGGGGGGGYRKKSENKNTYPLF